MIELSKLKSIFPDCNYAYVLGMGKSGYATAKALRRSDWHVYAWDDDRKCRDSASKKAINERLAIEFMSDMDTLGLKNKHSGIIIPSPGIPQSHPAIQKARDLGYPILGDIELYGLVNKGLTTIGITGTNGKSTTTALTGHILDKCGIEIAVGGNIGTPVMDLNLPTGDGVAVLEISSFQLNLCPSYSPDISVLLNISPDHIDRHGSLEAYAAAKELIFRGPGKAIMSMDDSWSRSIYKRVKKLGERECYQISVGQTVNKGVFVENGKLYDVMFGEVTEVMTIDQGALLGEHNQQNTAFAYAAARLMGLSTQKIKASIKSFKGLAHRQQIIGIIDGNLYINDSKATNANAASRALACYENIYWIVGGRAKDGGLEGLEGFSPKIKHAFVIGEASQEIGKWLALQAIPYSEAGTIDRAVEMAHHMAQGSHSKVTVLLSPACASFDQFKNFEVRGQVFTDIVNNLKEEAA